jgi:hypothetical protein
MKDNGMNVLRQRRSSALVEEEPPTTENKECEKSSVTFVVSTADDDMNGTRGSYWSTLRKRSSSIVSRRASSFQESFGKVRKSSLLMLQDTATETRRVVRVSVSALINEEIQRITQKRSLIFPEAPEKWDMFWAGMLVVFIATVLPGFYMYYSQSLSQGVGAPYWKPIGQSVFFENVKTGMEIYETPHYGVLTPLRAPMPNHFVFHVLFGTLASVLLIMLFTTGRVMRWRIADGTVDYDSAEDLHKLSAFWSLWFWLIIIGTGTYAIPLLHPTLQYANYAEMVGVATLFVGTLLSAYFRQWILHRLCSWGLIYSATASVFLLVNGRALQAYSSLPCFYIKAINYILAFSIPIVGILRDTRYEFSKLNNVEDNVSKLREIAKKTNQQLQTSRRSQFGVTPFQAARGDKKRRLSLWQHITQAEPLEDYTSRRHSSVSRTQNSIENSTSRSGKTTQNAIDSLLNNPEFQLIFEEED